MKKTFSYLLPTITLLLIPLNTSALISTFNWTQYLDEDISIKGNTDYFDTCTQNISTGITTCEIDRITDPSDILNVTTDLNFLSRIGKNTLYVTENINPLDVNYNKISYLQSNRATIEEISNELEATNNGSSLQFFSNRLKSNLSGPDLPVLLGAHTDYTAEFVGSENVSAFSLGAAIVFNNKYVTILEDVNRADIYKNFKFLNTNEPILFTYGNFKNCEDNHNASYTTTEWTKFQPAERFNTDPVECHATGYGSVHEDSTAPVHDPGGSSGVFGTEYNWEIFPSDFKWYWKDSGDNIVEYTGDWGGDVDITDGDIPVNSVKYILYVADISFINDSVPTLDIGRTYIQTTDPAALVDFADYRIFIQSTNEQKQDFFEELAQGSQWTVTRENAEGDRISYFFDYETESCISTFYAGGEFSSLSYNDINENSEKTDACFFKVDEDFLTDLKVREYFKFFLPVVDSEDQSPFYSFGARYYNTLLFPITLISGSFHRDTLESYDERLCLFDEDYAIDKTIDNGFYSELEDNEIELYNNVGGVLSILCIDVNEIRTLYNTEKEFSYIKKVLTAIDTYIVLPFVILLFLIYMLRSKRN